MWVLIMFVGLSGTTLSSVPGYADETVCTAAGKEYVTRAIVKTGRLGSFICVPGPAQKIPSVWAGEIEK